MRLYEEIARKLVDKKIDCHKRMFGYYPMLICERDGRYYTKDNVGACCQILESKDDLNCYYFDFVIDTDGKTILAYDREPKEGQNN